MAKKETKVAFLKKTPRKRPGFHSKPKGNRTGLFGKHQR
jgi:hypothetical protein